MRDTHVGSNQPAAAPRMSRRRFAGLAGLTSALAAGASGLVLPTTTHAQDQEGQIIPIDQATEVAEQDDGSTTTGGRYFAETGHNLQGSFLRRWRNAGGAAVLGLPLSEERYVEGSGGIQQTFETLTLLHDPTLEAPWDIQAMHLAATTIRGAVPASARTAVSGCSGDNRTCQFFPDSQHTISGEFLTFWEEHGGLQIFGMPRSEAATQNGLTVQAFERAILELGADRTVRVRRLWADRIATEGTGDDPAFAPAPPNGGTTSLVSASEGLRLRTGPGTDAEIIVVLPDNAEFVAPPGEHGEWVPGYVDGFAGWVAAEYLVAPAALPQIAAQNWEVSVWQGATLSETNIRAEPTTTSRVVTELIYGDAVTVVDWVKGEEVFEGADGWARLEDGGFIYARNVGRAAPVMPPSPPTNAPAQGRWIDVHLTQQLIVAYEGRTPVRTVVTTTGMPGWETPEGSFAINTRVANETMTAEAIGAEGHYKLEDVLFTQYFTDVGHALHFAWWRTPETIGRPGSHGCLNLLLDDARFFWEWATIGTTVICHR
ncbi:MAG: L,D-transpeptidase family protein [Chloroflexia bacterium]|nr:L,D-transpeptidase family protein [Chloroflexia bacterium]